MTDLLTVFNSTYESKNWLTGEIFLGIWLFKLLTLYATFIYIDECL